jgi:hypothetical protein
MILKPAVPFIFFEQRNELGEKVLILFHIVSSKDNGLASQNFVTGLYCDLS